MPRRQRIALMAQGQVANCGIQSCGGSAVRVVGGRKGSAVCGPERSRGHTAHAPCWHTKERKKARHEPPENPVSRKIDSGRKDTRPNFATANAIAMEYQPSRKSNKQRCSDTVHSSRLHQGSRFFGEPRHKNVEYQSRFVSKITVNYEL